jgi:hypothetical protein
MTSEQHRWSQYYSHSSLTSSALQRTETWITHSLHWTEHWETHKHHTQDWLTAPFVGMSPIQVILACLQPSGCPNIPERKGFRYFKRTRGMHRPGNAIPPSCVPEIVPCVFSVPAVLNTICSGFGQVHWHMDCRVYKVYKRATLPVCHPSSLPQYICNRHPTISCDSYPCFSSDVHNSETALKTLSVFMIILTKWILIQEYRDHNITTPVT